MSGVSDNFTFGSCIDKTLIYTDEMWFTPQNVEESKCILECTETYVNVKHQAERLLKRTPCLSTSNDNPCSHGRSWNHEEQVTYIHNKKAHETIKWGAIELNPLMWLTIWRTHIDNYIEKNFRPEYLSGEDQPKSSRNYRHLPSDCYSPKKKLVCKSIRKKTRRWPKQRWAFR